MLRRDYVLRMIEQCIQALTRSLRSMQQGQFDLASQEVNQAVQSLVGLDLPQVNRLSETELLSALLTGEPTQTLRQKCMMLVALLHRAGDIFTQQGNDLDSRTCYLRALNVQLDVLLREGAFDFPEFVPKVEVLVQTLAGTELPAMTLAALMRHYESTGQFAKAEDTLFCLLDAHPGQPDLVAFGIQFYDRLARQSDEALLLGNLPRGEVQAGLAELQARV